jgi:hypothetical protein
MLIVISAFGKFFPSLATLERQCTEFGANAMQKKFAEGGTKKMQKQALIPLETRVAALGFTLFVIV